jgi:hypothetical protein
MKLEGLTVTMTFDQLCETAVRELTHKQNIELAKRCAYYGKAIDMSYVEDLLVMAAKLRLKSIKKDKALYHRNRQYFNALKAITKIKYAE